MAAHGAERDRLDHEVRSVRARWRLRRAMRGAMIAVAALFVLLALAAFVARALHYGDAALLILRLLLALGAIVLAWRLVVRPLRAAPSAQRVALYAEEHARTLDGVLVTAVELPPAAPTVGLTGRLLHSALERMHRLGDGAAVEGSALRQHAVLLAAVTATAIAAIWFGPAALRHGVRVLLAPVMSELPAGLYTIAVRPGNATVAKGGDQLVTATLRGFQSERVELLLRASGAPAFTRVAMASDSLGRWAFRLFDIAGRTEYAVEANGVRSPAYHLDVADLPYVKRIDLEYRFPPYTQLPPQRVDSTGDIAALVGTMVRVQVRTTAKAAGGRLVVDGGDTLALAPTADGALLAMLRVRKSGFYRVELQGSNGTFLTGSLDYTIDALPDRPPTVAFVKPGRDTRALAVDEVYTEAKASDDYGVARLELVYSVNGGAEKTVPLGAATSRVLRDIVAGHAFELEHERLHPGDVVSYFARATDNNAVGGAQSATSDIYFIQVRPYANDYRQSQSGGGGGQQQQQQQGDQPGQLSQKERDIVAATFNVGRDSAALDRRGLEERLTTLRLSQEKLHQQVNDLATRLVERGIAAMDSNWKQIAEILPKATATMDTAEKQLAAGTPRGALPAEQRALQQLLHADAVFRDIQVQMSQGGRGGGGGAQRTDAQDLADIFELQKDKLRNQYEQVQRGDAQAQPPREGQVDELLEKLKQLAARQQQEDERARRKADSLSRLGAGGASGGASQRQLAQDAEQAARQLERLAREQQSPSLADAARRLQEASDAMRRAAANGQQGSAQSRNALDRLQDARRLLDQDRAGQAQRDVEDAQRTARALAEQEQRIGGDVQRMKDAAGTERQQLAQSLGDRKRAMADTLRDLTSRLDRGAQRNARTTPNASRALGEAADTLRGRRIEDRVRATQQAIGTASQDYLDSIERSIDNGLKDLEGRLQRAAGAASEMAQGQQQRQSLDRMRDLVREMEGIAERAQQQQERQQVRQGRSGQQGHQGQQAQQGQGAQGQQGQTQGQSGQQGRAQAQGQAQGQGQGQQPGGASGGRGGGGARGGTSASGLSGAGAPGNGMPGAGAPNSGAPGLGDARQLAREMQERIADAEALRRDLQQQGFDTAPLGRAIEGMRAAERMQRTGDDTHTASDLRAQLLDRLKAYEFTLRRAVEGADAPRVMQSRPGEVPASFRAWVDEYYRSIAKQKP
jgi:hypothetical protein